MSDPLEIVINDIHTELERRCAREIGLGVRKFDKDEHKGAPRVLWVEQGGATEMPPETITDTLAYDISAVAVTVWGPSSEYVRKLYWNLQQAAHLIWGHDLVWTRRSPPNAAEQLGIATSGFVIESECRIILRVRQRPYQLPDEEIPPVDFLERSVTGHSIAAEIDDDG